MGKVHKATPTYRIFHWDTFDDQTTEVATRRTLKDARAYVLAHFNVRPTGADRVDIVDEQGNVVEKFSIG